MLLNVVTLRQVVFRKTLTEDDHWMPCETKLVHKKSFLSVDTEEPYLNVLLSRL